MPGGVLVASTDPITLTTAEIGRLSVIVNANDVAVTGARPRWFLVVILVPPGTTEAVIRDLFTTVRHALACVSAHLVGGHTEVTPAVARPIVVGQMLGLAEAGRFVPTGGVLWWCANSVSPANHQSAHRTELHTRTLPHADETTKVQARLT